MTTYKSIQMELRSSPPESQRKPGFHLLSYRWEGSNVMPYDGEYPITLGTNDPFTFYLHDYTQALTGPTLKVKFEPFPGGQGSSPFSSQDTANLVSGVTASGQSGGAGGYNVFEFGPFNLVNPGVEFEFSLEIDDGSNPQQRWYVDPQMIVEQGG